jgi:hypothetical protein
MTKNKCWVIALGFNGVFPNFGVNQKIAERLPFKLPREFFNQFKRAKVFSLLKGTND